MTRDRELEATLHTWDTHTRWICSHLEDLHELAYGQASRQADVTVQSHPDHDIANLIDTHAQHVWATVRDLTSRIVTLRRTLEQLWGHERPEWRPRQRDMDRPTRQALQAAQDRRRARGEWTPTRVVHGGDDR